MSQVTRFARGRTTLYAAFHGEGTPSINVWSWSRKDAETMVADRAANGEGFPGERVVRCTIEFYNRQLIKAGASSAQVLR